MSCSAAIGRGPQGNERELRANLHVAMCLSKLRNKHFSSHLLIRLYALNTVSFGSWVAYWLVAL